MAGGGFTSGGWYIVTLMGRLAHLHVFQLEAQQRNRPVVPLA
jgi:hypothetical protein